MDLFQINQSQNIWKTKFVIGLFVAVVVLFPSKSFAVEKITSFDAKITINQDSGILVEENIKYDFGNTERHGIFRDIPTKYKTDYGNRSIRLKVLEVQRDGLAEPYTYIGDQIKIGDANQTISGVHNYSIKYQVLGALNNFQDIDELYWNVSGNGWPVGIDQVKATVVLPQMVSQNILKTSCYQGSVSSQEKCLVSYVGGSTVFESNRSLNVGEGLTLAIGFPKGIVVPISGTQKAWWWLRDNYIAFLPLFVFAFLFRRWKKYGKDPIGRSTIIAEYEPPQDVHPTLVGALVDEKVDNRDISAGLIYIAEQGYVKISKIETKNFLGFKSTDYQLELIKNPAGLLEKTKLKIIDMFFGQSAIAGTVVNISSFKNDNSFVAEANKLKNSIYQEMADRGFYLKNPMKAQIPYLVIALIIAIFGSMFAGAIFGFIGIIAFVISGILFFIFSRIMSKKTPLGAETKDDILGFKLFLSVTEKDRLDFHNAPERSPEQFMEFLPYAIALGIENKWAAQFASIYIPEPSWYHGGVHGPFLASAFVSDLSHFSGSVSSSFTSASRGGSGSGGGGSSGGGFGGGGGGSW